MQNIPKHLSKKSKKFFKYVINEYELEEHHIKTLTLACECLDRIEEARVIINEEGIVYYDKWNKPKPHPALKTEEQNKIIFARLIRELNLDYDESNRQPGRPPNLY